MPGDITFKGRGNGAVPEPKPEPTLKAKQKQSIVEEYNKPDPVGDFVRRITGANREKKKTGF